MRSTLLTPALAEYAAGRTIAPLWIAPNGRRFFPIAGGADDDPPKDDPPKSDPPKQDDPPKFEAITSQEDFDRRLSARLARERDKYSDYETLKAAKVEYDKVLEAAKSDQEKAVDAARKEGETEGRKISDARIVIADAKVALATAHAKNPGAAVKLLNLADVKLGDDGEVDPAVLKAKIDALKESDDYLFGDGKPTTKGPKPDKSQGGSDSDAGSAVSRGRDLRAGRRPKTKTS